MSSISLGKGLVSSSAAAVVTASPSGLSGFSLGKGASRSFVFKVKASKAGKVTLSVAGDGKTSSGAAVHGSGELAVTVGGVGIVVNTTSDAPVDPKALAASPPRCVTDVNAGKELCSLRAAIQLVNKLGGKQTIGFDIPGGGVPKVAPASPLPALSASVTIDGTTQSGGWVELSGASAGGGDGLELDGSSSSVRGLVINGFVKGAGVRIEKGSGDVIAGDRIGTDAAGLVAVPDKNGVLVDGPDATVGGVDGTSASGCTGDCNLISGNSEGQVSGPSPAPATGVPFAGLRVEGDWIGVDSTGERSLFSSDAAAGVSLVMPDDLHGPMLTAAEAVAIGGTTSRAGLAPGNLIDGRTAVLIAYVLTHNTVRYAGTVSGNLIGLDATGTKAVGNGDIGVDLIQTNIEVGGTKPETGNVISGFPEGVQTDSADIDGNFIGTDVTGTKAVGNTVGVVSINGGIGSNNVISGNHIGVEAKGNGSVGLGSGDLIGLARDGTHALPNEIGISASSVNIGLFECSSDPCDVISGNTVAGIQIVAQGVGAGFFSFFRIKGAYIGSDITGNHSVPNGVGIDATVSPNTKSAPLFEFGGPSTAFKGGGCHYPCDLIAGNTGAGLRLDTDAGSATDLYGGATGDHSFIEGSYIGVSANGSPMPNGGAGIDILGLPSANPMLVGGDTAKGNVLAGSTEPAVSVVGTTKTAKTPPVSLLTNRFEMQGLVPPIVRLIQLPHPPPVLSDTVTGTIVAVTGSTNVPSDPIGPGETVEIYASATCGGTRQPVGLGIPATLSGDFIIDVPVAALKGLPYLSALRTNDSGNTSRFAATCLRV